MKATVTVPSSLPRKVNASQLPVGRICKDECYTVLKLSESAVLVVNADGHVCPSTDPGGWDLPRELQPDGVTITITT